MDCRRLDANDPAAIEARADNEDYDDHPTPPPQPPPSPLPPSAPTDLDFRSRDTGEGLTSSADDGGGRRREFGVRGDEVDLMRRDGMDLWTRTTDKTESERDVSNVVDPDDHCKSSACWFISQQFTADFGPVYAYLNVCSVVFFLFFFVNLFLFSMVDSIDGLVWLTALCQKDPN